jgi:hypothetical protein
MCYNRPAVERAAKEGLSSAVPKPASDASQQAAPHVERSAVTGNGPSVMAESAGGFAMAENAGRAAIAEDADRLPAAQHEDASRYCPVCSRRLESRRCKLTCPVCGYYMSCADYY